MIDCSSKKVEMCYVNVYYVSDASVSSLGTGPDVPIIISATSESCAIPK